MTKLQAIYKDLQKAFGRLEETLTWKPTIPNQDATIQRFEFTFELAWKLMNIILRENGIEAYGPKNTFREAAKLRLIDNPKIWFDFLKQRNLTVHTYKEEIARKVYKKAKEFIPYVKNLIKKASTYL